MNEFENKYHDNTTLSYKDRHWFVGFIIEKDGSKIEISEEVAKEIARDILWKTKEVSVQFNMPFSSD